MKKPAPPAKKSSKKTVFKPVKKAAKKVRVAGESKNGFTRPSDPTSATGRIWHIADRLTTQKKRTATIAELREGLAADKLDEGTIAQQYYRWKKFNGYESVYRGGEAKAKKPKAPKSKPAAKKPAPPAKKKAAAKPVKAVKKPAPPVKKPAPPAKKPKPPAPVDAVVSTTVTATPEAAPVVSAE